MRLGCLLGFYGYMAGRALSKSFISRVIIGVTPFRVLITLLITYLLSPSYTLQNPNLHNYYPKTEYLIIRSFGPLGIHG